MYTAKARGQLNINTSYNMYYEKDNYKNQNNNQLNYNSINPELKQL